MLYKRTKTFVNTAALLISFFLLESIRANKKLNLGYIIPSRIRKVVSLINLMQEKPVKREVFCT